MRFTTVFFVFFLLLISFTNAQSQLVRNPVTIRINENQYINFDDGKFSEIDFLKTKKMPEINYSKILIWKWDTLYTYDTANLPLRRLVQTFDNYGNISRKTIAQLVSGVWSEYNRQSFTYNLWGKVTKWLLEYNNSGVWTYSYKETSLYDENGNLLSSVLENWQNTQWILSTKWTFTYDNNNNKITELYEPDTSNQLTTKHRCSYTYNTNNNLIISLFEIWKNNNWDSNERVTFTYDTNNFLIQRLSLRWGNPFNYNRAICVNDTNGNVLSYISDFSTDYINWSNIYKSEYTYDLNNNVLSALFTSFVNNVWVNNSLKLSSYNSNGYLLSETSKSWQNEEWVNYLRLDRSYDVSDNMLSESKVYWYNNIWNVSQRWTYTYDANGNSISGKYEDDNATGIIHPASVYDNCIYVFSNKSIVDYISYAHRYSVNFTSISSVNDNFSEENLLRIYPNPASDYIDITVVVKNKYKKPMISVYDFQSRLLFQQPMLDNFIRIDISNLAKGMYFITLDVDDIKVTKKLIKE